MQINRLVTILAPRPIAPQPHWEGLFLEPIYADGLPYQTAAHDQFEDDDPAAA